MKWQQTEDEWGEDEWDPRLPEPTTQPKHSDLYAPPAHRRNDRNPTKHTKPRPSSPPKQRAWDGFKIDNDFGTSRTTGFAFDPRAFAEPTPKPSHKPPHKPASAADRYKQSHTEHTKGKKERLSFAEMFGKDKKKD